MAGRGGSLDQGGRDVKDVGPTGFVVESLRGEGVAVTPGDAWVSSPGPAGGGGW